MERRATLDEAKQILGKNYLGPDILNTISEKLGCESIDLNQITPLNYKISELKENANNCLLIYGYNNTKSGKPYTLNFMRDFFGTNPNVKEPCFYNQDWYINETFAKKETLTAKWYLVPKSILQESRGKTPEEESIIKLPSAILTAFCFFAYFILTNEALWPNDYLWCSNKDDNGDIIYTGRYSNINKNNSKGFEIHRHLTIKNIYGSVFIQ